MATRWSLITGEYPPQAGGVSDYTQILARALIAAGDEVHVWAPSVDGSVVEERDASGAIIHRLRSGFGIAGLSQLSRELDALPRPYRILVQYVPHAFGWKAMNVPFCCWLWLRRRTPVWVMFHEVVFPLRRGQPLRHKVLGVVTCLMASLVIRSAERIFVSTPSWGPFVRAFGRRDKPIEWLPVPSTIVVVPDSLAAQEQRKKLAGPQEILLGHFGTYGPYMRNVLRETFFGLLAANENRRVVLLGRGSASFLREVSETAPDLWRRATALDGVSPETASAGLAACDVAVQPYEDGISTRRTSAMAALALSIPVVTNEGPLSEPLWRESGAVMLAADASSGALVQAVEDLLRCPAKKKELQDRAAALYRDRFAIERTVEALRKQA